MASDCAERSVTVKIKKMPAIRSLGTALLWLTLAGASQAAPIQTQYSTVDLIAESATLPADGGTVTVGFYLKPNPTWHAYWKNPGDAGKEPTLDWTLPDGFEVSEFAFPAPHLLPFGGLKTYGFEEEIMLLAELVVPDGLAVGDAVELAGQASWVICDDQICVPDKATVSLTLIVGNGRANPALVDRFAAARKAIPSVVEWPATFSVQDEKLEVRIAAADLGDGFENPYLFVESRNLAKYGRQAYGLTQTGLLFSMDAAANVASEKASNAVLTYTNSDGQAVAVGLELVRDAAASAGAMVFSDAGGLTLWRAALYAFIGGLFLNLMPCVFPILSMKALSLVNIAQQDQRAARESGVIYTIGVLVAFAAIAATILWFRAAGNTVYWGFQFQNGTANFLVALLMVAIGLNLLGVFEVGTRMMGVGNELTQGGERKSAFFTGLLAVVVATPCGAPFMASAIGFAFQQPAAVLISIFLALGFGLAFPYLLFSFVPNVGSKLPKPGPWMETFKHILAFPMFLAAAYFLWVGGRVLGVSSMFAGLVAALAMAFMLWAYGKAGMARSKRGWYATALMALAATVYMFMQVDANKLILDENGLAVAGSLGGLELEHFDPEKVKQYIAADQPTFVYFTADWCISCKANERVALSTDTVAEAFNSRGIKIVEGDWTTEDPVITDWLEMYDRAGVPLYLYFPQGSSLETVTILPQILTPGIVVDAIVAADERAAARFESGTQETLAEEEAAAATYVIPDAVAEWAPIEDYVALDTVWHETDRAIRRAESSDEEKDRRREEELGPHPDVEAAMASAAAIVRLDGSHEKTVEAAAFLVEHTRGVAGQTESMVLGIRTLSKHFPQYEKWAQALFYLDFTHLPDVSADVEAVFEQFVSADVDAVAKAHARYYMATRFLQRVNGVTTPAAKRASHRRRGIELATGLSIGVENEDLQKRQRFTNDGKPIPFPTLAEAERDLLYNLNFLTVGSKIPEVKALNLRGIEESIRDYDGQAVLLDFWATWCGPCIASLPKLTALSEALPENDFEVLSISVDEKIETIEEFQSQKPMPWANWHVGPDGDILQAWAVKGYPNYILIDHEGTIIARQFTMDEEFESLIKATVRRE